MRNRTIFIIVFCAIVVAVVLLFTQFYGKNGKTTANDSPNPPTANNKGISGCYVATLGPDGKEDVYTLNIQSENHGNIQGLLSFDNFQIDSSSGPIVGKYIYEILLADYSFNAEGASSVMQVIFKKTNDGFVRGVGSTTVEDNYVRFADLSQISYENGTLFRTSPCL